jgi:HEAT repeat protein
VSSPSKKEIVILLEKKDYDALSKRASADRKVVSTLISLTYDKDNALSWRAMEAIGLITKDLSKSDPGAVRNIANRLLWMMRDESGGIAWSAPEILGEIVKNNPGLCSDFALIITSFHDELMFTSGVLWALGRMGKINVETVDYAVPIIRSYLASADNTLRGYAARALGEMGVRESSGELESMKRDPGHIRFYEEGEIKNRSIGEIAEAALAKIKSGQ